jgi:hypothetical protein
MELSNIREISYKDLHFEKYEFFIAACGYQSRSHFLAGKVGSGIKRKYVLTIEEPGLSQPRMRNKEIFKGLGFNLLTAHVNDTQAVENLIHRICNLSKSDPLHLLIDYSCMPKSWYSVLLDSITRDNFHAKRINLSLSYTPKIFEKHPRYHEIEYLGPILSRKDNLKAQRPVTVLAGLDHNGELTAKFVKEIKPEKTFFFIPDCEHDPDYTRSVLNSNRQLLDAAEPSRIIRYEANYPARINTLLTSISLTQRINNEVMIVPQGPKTFSMTALLVSIRYPDIKLWEMIGKSKMAEEDKGLPAGNPVVIDVTFVNDEDYPEDEDD